MKTLLNIAFLILGCNLMFAQNTNTVPVTNSESTKSPKLEEKSDTIKLEEIQSTSKSTRKTSKSKYKADKNASAEDMLENTTDSNKANSFYQIKSLSATQSTQRSPSVVQQAEMDLTVDYYETNAPNSFEFHYFKYVSGNYNLDLVTHLLEAQKLKPNNSDVYVQLAAVHFIQNDKTKLKSDLEFLYKNNRIEKEVISYGKDLLNSVEDKGILLTHGFDDTYSLLYLQEVEHFRTDVTVISADFMQSPQYVEALKTKGFKFPDSKTVDCHFVSAFCKLNIAKNLQLSMTFPKPYLNELYSNLNIMGVTFLYQENYTNLFEWNKRFYETKLQKKEITLFTTDKCKKLSANYLPVVLSLEEGFKTEKNTEKADELHQLATKLKAQANITKKISSY